MPDTGPKTLIEAVQHFSDRGVCHAYMLKLKWPDGKIVCPKCGGDKIGNIASRSMLQCKAKDCRKQFSTKLGTIFEDSPLGLEKWFVAVWCIANFKMGVSSHELGRTLGVTQKTAWFMLHRIRQAHHLPSSVRHRRGRFYGSDIGGPSVAKKKPTPNGGKAFDELARKLVQVPKKELDRAENRYQKKKSERKK